MPQLLGFGLLAAALYSVVFVLNRHAGGMPGDRDLYRERAL